MRTNCPKCKSELTLSVIEVIPVDDNLEDDIEHGPDEIDALICKCGYWEYVEISQLLN